MEPLMIEVALNEQAEKAANPAVPYSAEECIVDAIACIEAGASIIHFHAETPSPERCWCPASRIRARHARYSEVRTRGVCYPTYAGRRIYPPSAPEPPRSRSRSGLPHRSAREDPDVKLGAATIDPGAVNWSRLDPRTGEIGWGSLPRGEPCRSPTRAVAL